MKETANGTACGKMTVNDAEYIVLKLLGKGKGGYSYLMTDGEARYVLKQLHHEPCEYYTFGDKLQAELHDYETLQKLGIPMPKLLAVDAPRERILKEYIAGETAAERFITSTTSATPIWSNGILSIGASSIGRRRHRKERRKHEKPQENDHCAADRGGIDVCCFYNGMH